MGGLGDEASHLADPHPTALTMSANLMVRYTFQHGQNGCIVSLMDSVLLGYNGLFILSLSWTSFFSQKRPCDIIVILFVHRLYTRSLFHLEWTKSSSNRFNFAGYTSKTTLTSRCLLYYCILASSIFFRLSCHTLISEIILHRPTFKWHWQLYFHLDPEATIPTWYRCVCGFSNMNTWFLL